MAVVGDTRTYRRKEKGDPSLEIMFCSSCAGVIAWRGLRPEEDGRTRMAVNVRLTQLQAVAALPIDHFDGADTFEDLPPSGKLVEDLWA